MKVLALGGFDGLHRGHMAIVDRAVSLSADASVLCFEPVPRQVLACPKHARLTTPGERRKILSDAGLCGLVVHPFDGATMASGPCEFLDAILESCCFEQIVVGYDFGFGSGRAGSTPTLRAWCDERSVGLHVVDPVCHGGEPVKSRRIRLLISQAGLDEAAELLGREYSALGAVSRGTGLSRKLGFPTLNVRVPEAKLLPPPGSYAATVDLDGSVRPAAVFIPRGDACVCEAHIPGWSGDAYGRAAWIGFRRFLRPPESGLTSGELTGRIARDVERVLEVVKG